MAASSGAHASNNLVVRLLRAVGWLVIAFTASLMLTILIEWIGLTFIWYEAGAERSADVLRQDLRWLTSHQTATFADLPSTAELVAQVAGGLYYWLFRWTGADQALNWLASTGAVGPYPRATLNTVQIYFVRVAITVTALPLFAVAAWWGPVEGIIRRDLRRFGGDIEHGTLYHWAKHIAGGVLFIPIIIYLAWPGSINPATLFMPFAAGLGINLMIVTTNFTKYI